MLPLIRTPAALASPVRNTSSPSSRAPFAFWSTKIRQPLAHSPSPLSISTGRCRVIASWRAVVKASAKSMLALRNCWAWIIRVKPGVAMLARMDSNASATMASISVKPRSCLGMTWHPCLAERGSCVLREVRRMLAKRARRCS
ncbi:hypothetical protein D3C78_1376000 [compost metagenome]